MLVSHLTALGLDARAAARSDTSSADTNAAVAVLGVAPPSGLSAKDVEQWRNELGLTGDLARDGPKLRALARDIGIELPAELEARLAPELSEQDEADLNVLLEAAADSSLSPVLRRQASERAEQFLNPAEAKKHVIHMETHNTATGERGGAVVTTGDNDCISEDRNVRDTWLERVRRLQAEQVGWRLEDTEVSVSEAAFAAARAAAVPGASRDWAAIGPWEITVAYRNTRTGEEGQILCHTTDGACVSRDPVVHGAWIDRLRHKQVGPRLHPVPGY